MERENKYGRCYCDKVLGVPFESLYFHLSGCPIGDEADYMVYESWPWWKKLLMGSPKRLYAELLR